MPRKHRTYKQLIDLALRVHEWKNQSRYKAGLFLTNAYNASECDRTMTRHAWQEEATREAQRAARYQRMETYIDTLMKDAELDDLCATLFGPDEYDLERLAE